MPNLSQNRLFFAPCYLEISWMTLKKPIGHLFCDTLITPENFMVIQWEEHCEKVSQMDGRTDRQTDIRTDRTVLRAAWSHLKNIPDKFQKIWKILPELSCRKARPYRRMDRKMDRLMDGGTNAGDNNTPLGKNYSYGTCRQTEALTIFCVRR